MDNLDNFESYDHLLVEPFARYGWQTEFVSWRNARADWNDYDVVIIRSPWDYHKEPDLFLKVLEEIDRSSARLENSLELVLWNINKTYLRDLTARGIDIVPTLWRDTFGADEFPELFDELETRELVIKPVISAGADNTFRVMRDSGPATIKKLETTFSDRPFMVQPFINNIVEEGEFSLFFFGGEYSHTILKTPKEKDFRVQEEHGGTLTKAEPPRELLTHAQAVMESVQPQPLYARVDSVRTGSGTFALMELELIEPSLYFNMDPDSPERFARIFNRWMQKPDSI